MTKFIKNTIFEVMSNDIYSLNVFSELWACPRAERVGGQKTFALLIANVSNPSLL